MAAYFDSSVLLSLLLGDANAQWAEDLWDSELDRVSSLLLELECTTVLRRVLTAVREDVQRKETERRLALALEEVTLKPVDEDIAAQVRGSATLAGCRTLDAVHLATALYFRAGEPDLRVYTFDARMAEIASRLNFTVCRPTGL